MENYNISISWSMPHRLVVPAYVIVFEVACQTTGEATLASKQNASLIYTVIEGSGHSMIGGQRFDWELFDTFCVPGGEWVEHTNGSDAQDAILFVSSDEPTLKALRFYMRHGRTPEGDLAVID